MNAYLLEGLLLGYAYAMPIGSQNIFVIQSAARHGVPHAYRTAATVALMDISLALACVYGIGALVNTLPIIRGILTVLGAIYMAWIGYHIFRSIPLQMEPQAVPQVSSWAMLRTAFVLTWFNPQAVIDGSVILGAFKAQSQEGLTAFLGGMSLASASWFFGITTLIGVTRRALNSKHLKLIHMACGLIMCALAVRMLYTFLSDKL